MAAHPLKLFIANKNYSSWSLRPWVLMRMLAIPFDEQLVPFGAGSQAAGLAGDAGVVRRCAGRAVAPRRP